MPKGYSLGPWCLSRKRDAVESLPLLGDALGGVKVDYMGGRVVGDVSIPATVNRLLLWWGGRGEVC